MSTINFKEITEGCIAGKGVFDEMMRSVKAHLTEEYDNNRIRGPEYTKVYVESLGNAMSQSIQWHLAAETNRIQAKLLEQQVIGQTKQNALLDEQLVQTVLQSDLLRIQIANTTEEGKLIPIQADMLTAQVLGQGLQNQLVTQQTLTEEQNTATATFNVNSMLPAQKIIMDQKLITEQAQTEDTSVKGNILGIVGAQRELYKKQTEGFIRDAEQKAARTITDIYGVALSSDVTSIPNAIRDENINSLLENLRVNGGLGTGDFVYVPPE